MLAKWERVWYDKNVMEVNKKVGAGAQKNGAAGRPEQPNVRVVGVRGEAESVRAGAVEQILKAAGRPGKTTSRKADCGLESLNEPARGLVVRLAADYPELRFRVGKRFMFRPARTIVMEAPVAEFEAKNECAEAVNDDSGGLGGGENEWALQLLHEVGHALSGHREFRTDPERLVMEREAWERARELAATYNIRYDEEFVEGALDTYRDWLHQRSACPECGLTRYQTVDGRWHCPLCEGL